LDPSFVSFGFENNDKAGEIRITWSWLVMMCIRRIGNTLEYHLMAFNITVDRRLAWLLDGADIGFAAIVVIVGRSELSNLQIRGEHDSHTGDLIDVAS
jgi:hypothetical protein